MARRPVAVRIAMALAGLWAAAPAGREAAARPADTDRRIEELAAQAHADYLTGEYARSARRLLEAYGVKPVPKLLFNAAKAYEKGEMYPEAAAHFRRFLREASPEDPLAAKAEESLKAMAARSGPDGAGGGAASAGPAPAVAAPAAPAAEPAPGNARSWAIFGVAAAAAAAAGTFGVLALKARDDFEAQTSLGARDDAREASLRRALVADVAWGLSATAAILGVVLWRSAPADPGAAAVGLVLGGPGAAAATVLRTW